ncbi:MAG: hypothetical protein AB8H03_04295 [Saprospiraceae bacterium]
MKDLDLLNREGNWKSRITQLISGGEIEKAISLYLNSPKITSEEHKNLILLSSKVNQLKKSVNKGIISYSDFNIENMKTAEVILNLLVNHDNEVRNEESLEKLNFIEGWRNISKSRNIYDLEPSDILDLRISSYRKYYFERETDEYIYNYLKTEKNLILIGNSLSGKTRSVLEGFIKLKSEKRDVEILFPRLRSEVKLPYFQFHSNKKYYAFFDDIDDFYRKSKKVNKLLKFLLQKGVSIIATCRTGPEYRFLHKKIKGNLREQFKVIHLNKVSKQVSNKIITDNNIEENVEIDGNIGSIFLPIVKMRERYYELENSKDPIDRLSISILKSLKALYYSSNFESKSSYLQEKVSDYCLRLNIGSLASPHKKISSVLEQQLQGVVAELQREKITSFFQNYQESIQRLESDIYNLNFIEIPMDQIKVEEVYLEKIVRYDPMKIIYDIKNIYNYEERKELGFYVKTTNYNDLISKSNDVEQANSIFNEMVKNGIKPNLDSFHALIDKSYNFDAALKVYNRLEKYNFTPILSTFSLIAEKIDSDDNLIKMIQLTTGNLIEVNNNKEINILISHLLNKVNEFQTLQVVIAFLNKISTKINDKNIRTLFSKTNSTSELIFVHNHLKERQEIELTTYLVNRIAFVSNNLDEFKTNLLLFKKNNELKINAKSLNSLLYKHKGQTKKVKQVFEYFTTEMGVIPDNQSISHLLLSSDSFEYSFSILKKSMLLYEYTPDSSAFNELIRNIGSSNERLSERLSQLSELLEDFNAVFPEPNFNVIIQKIKDVDNAIEFLEFLKSKFNYKPNLQTLNTFLARYCTGDIFEETSRFSKILNVDFTPSETFYKIGIAKSKSIESAIIFMNQMINKYQFKPSVQSLNHLIEKLNYKNDLETILDLMTNILKLEPNNQTLSLVSTITNSFFDTYDIFLKFTLLSYPSKWQEGVNEINEIKNKNDAIKLLQKSPKFSDQILNMYCENLLLNRIINKEILIKKQNLKTLIKTKKIIMYNDIKRAFQNMN